MIPYLFGIALTLKWKKHSQALYLSAAPSPVIASKAKQGEGDEG